MIRLGFFRIFIKCTPCIGGNISVYEKKFDDHYTDTINFFLNEVRCAICRTFGEEILYSSKIIGLLT